MPKRLVEKLRSFIPGTGKKKLRPYQRREIPRDQHNVSRSAISEPAKKVLNRLNKAGFEAYLVGGGVRDILLGGVPKDFDIATNATPEEVHELFRNSRLIGRRFRIVHVVFGREVIEVTTFRGNASEAEDDAPDDDRKTSEHGLLLRDNVYGSQEEDALRRDFTVNALYYCIRDFTVIDFADGVEDLRNRQLRLIGDPETRYRKIRCACCEPSALPPSLILTLSRTLRPRSGSSRPCSHIFRPLACSRKCSNCSRPARAKRPTIC